MLELVEDTKNPSKFVRGWNHVAESNLGGYARNGGFLREHGMDLVLLKFSLSLVLGQLVNKS